MSRPPKTNTALLGRTGVLTALRAGQGLILEYSRSGPRWSLSDGRPVDSRVAELVILDPEIVGGDDALFPDAASQTFRVRGLS